ncbi:phosphomannomutase/phosphoglucomutase [Anaerofustis stercorihominis]|uniref:phosphomannomutase/phosphoglucomutase n=1 Tax=Anaerofustis stercorihominis TaxID=214853 RepID=UPI00214CFCCF|nr:phosphomannomutase/phosphoglucomutase [Anaerofustis stercorihominis]MCR2033196.1 phosphomannomutase/phosphoglucomutase [Anaerofustis stercorihominis]
MDLRKLQNGSDVRGIALEGIKGENVNLTNEASYKISKAFVKWLKKRLNKDSIKITIGRDSRLSGPDLAESVMKGLSSEDNVDVVYFDLCTTPAMFMSCVSEEVNADGAIMITASHLPFNRNGLKFFTKDGGAEKEDIKAILEIANDMNYSENEAKYSTLDFLSIYAGNLVKTIREKTGEEKPFEGKKIIVDAGNGAGGFFAYKVLDVLGADTSGSVYLEPDGKFPNHVPNPELKDVMDSFSEVVLKEKADLGIIFDTDVDRAAAVDKSGEEISRNKLVALMASICLQEAKGSYIVTDSVTSSGLKEFIEEKGGVHHRFKRGYKNVINEGIRLNKEGKECLLAIETSGHCALRENYFLDDGAYMVVKILIKFYDLVKEGKDFSDLIGSLKEAKEEAELRATFLVEDFKDYGAKLLEDFKVYVKEEMKGASFEEPNFEGVRVNVARDGIKGWVLLRLSLHDPVLPINIESENEGGVENIKSEILAFLDKYEVKL